MLPSARSSARNAAPPALALLACFALLACERETVDGPSPANDAKRGRAPIAVTPERSQAATQDQERIAAVRRASAASAAADPYANPEAHAKKPETEQAVAAKEEKPRDYAAELASVMRGTESCVKPRLASEALPSELSISLEGLVLESGTIVSGTARAPVLTPEELECVKRRLESSRLPADVKEAPRRVSATVKLKFKNENEKAGATPGAPTPVPAAPKAY